MKVGFQVEGRTDERVLPVLVEKILGTSIEVERLSRRAGGHMAVVRTLPNALWHFWRTSCVTAVIGIDANGSKSHDAHEEGAPHDCRHCSLSSAVERERAKLPARPPYPQLAVAVPVPIQAIEAWLLCLKEILADRPHRATHSIDRHAAKLKLWGSISPGPSEVDGICEGIFATVGRSELEKLAESQPSFARFATEVQAWKPLVEPTDE